MAFEPTKLNYKHDAILEFVVCNPQMTQNEIAAAMGYSAPWLSMIINSDMFQARYRELCEERRLPAMHSIREKMTRSASAALDAIQARLDGGLVSDRFLESVTPMLLDRVGHSPKQGALPPGAQVTQNNFFLNADDIELAKARRKARMLNEGTFDLEPASA